MWDLPFKHLRKSWEAENNRLVAEGKPRLRENEPRLQTRWWQLQRPRHKMRAKLASLKRYIATPRVAKFRTFTWLETSILPDTRVVAIARDDDTTFGILQSKYHELWALRYGARHGVGNDPEYVHTQTFETFPFPDGLTPDNPANGFAEQPRARAIVEAAKRLNELRENWLNPDGLVHIASEVVSGYPSRRIPVDEQAAKVLQKRTITQLYNERPTWLVHVHNDLDLAVAAAYGWPPDLSDREILDRLLALNQARVAGHEKKQNRIAPSGRASRHRSGAR
jgi:type II restriction/modification system DNA methylase subunit YeeA